MVFVLGAFAEMSEGLSRICGIITHELARAHASYYNDDAKQTKGMYRQHIQKAWGRLGSSLTAPGTSLPAPAHCGACGAAMSTDEEGQFDIETHHVSPISKGTPPHSWSHLLLLIQIEVTQAYQGRTHSARLAAYLHEPETQISTCFALNAFGRVV